MKKLMLSVLLALGFLTANAAKTTLTGHYTAVKDTQQELKLTLELTPTDGNKVRLSYTCETPIVGFVPNLKINGKEYAGLEASRNPNVTFAKDEVLKIEVNFAGEGGAMGSFQTIYYTYGADRFTPTFRLELDTDKATLEPYKLTIPYHFIAAGLEEGESLDDYTYQAWVGAIGASDSEKATGQTGNLELLNLKPKTNYPLYPKFVVKDKDGKDMKRANYDISEKSLKTLMDPSFADFSVIYSNPTSTTNSVSIDYEFVPATTLTEEELAKYSFRLWLDVEGFDDKESENTVNGRTGTFTVTGLDPDKTYRLWEKGYVTKDGVVQETTTINHVVSITTLGGVPAESFNVTISEHKAVKFERVSSTSGYYYFTFKVTANPESDFDNLDHFNVWTAIGGNESFNMTEVTLDQLEGSLAEGFSGRILAQGLNENGTTGVWPKVQAVSKGGKKSNAAELAYTLDTKETFNVTIAEHTAVKFVRNPQTKTEGDYYFTFKVDATEEEFAKIDHFNVKTSINGNEDLGLTAISFDELTGSLADGFSGHIHVTGLPKGQATQSWPKIQAVTASGTKTGWKQAADIIFHTDEVFTINFPAIEYTNRFQVTSPTGGIAIVRFKIAGEGAENIKDVKIYTTIGEGEASKTDCNVNTYTMPLFAYDEETGYYTASVKVNENLRDRDKTYPVYFYIKAISLEGKESNYTNTAAVTLDTSVFHGESVNKVEGNLTQAERNEDNTIKFHNPFTQEKTWYEDNSYEFGFDYHDTFANNPGITCGHSGGYTGININPDATANTWAENVRYEINNDENGYVFGTLTFNAGEEAVSPCPTAATVSINNVSFPVEMDPENHKGEFTTYVKYVDGQVLSLSILLQNWLDAERAGNIHSQTFNYTVAHATANTEKKLNYITALTALSSKYGINNAEDLRYNTHFVEHYSDTKQLVNNDQVDECDWKSTSRPVDEAEDLFWNPKFDYVCANKIIGAGENTEEVDGIYVAIEFENGTEIPLGLNPFVAIFEVYEDGSISDEWVGYELKPLDRIEGFDMANYQPNIYVGYADHPAVKKSAATFANGPLKAPADDTAKFKNGTYGFEFNFGYSSIIQSTGTSVTKLKPYIVNNNPEEDEKHTTAIENVKAEAAAPAMVNVYNLQGMAVRVNVAAADALRDLPAGIYIVNGKKYLVK